MTKSKYLLLGALAAASLSPAAFALAPGATLDAIVGTADEFFLSGATASDGAIKSFVKNDLCVAGTYDVYQDISGTTKGGNWFAMTCTLNGAAPVPASLFGHSVIIHKRAKIGSIYGVYPVALNSYVEFLNIRSDRGSGACVADTAANTYNCSFAVSPSALRDVPRHAGNGDECDYQSVAPANPASTGVAVTVAAGLDTLCRRASMGSSDVEAEVFSGQNLTNFPGDNFAKLTVAQINSLTRSKAFGQLFGVAVSNGVWNALQLAQYGANTAYVADGSNWPSLSSDTIRKILKGDAATWSAAVAGVTFPAAINNVNVCRREQGSGSQASSNLFFMNYPCDTAFAPAQDNTATWTTGLWIKENTSSTFVKGCLNDSEAGGTNANPLQTAGGIGVLSFNADPGASDTWKWVRINGVVPSMQNSILGLSNFWFETQLAYNKAMVAGPEKDLVTTIISEMGKATRIQTAAAKGIAAMSFTATVGAFDNGTNNTAFPNVYTATNPVMGGKHSSAAAFTSGVLASCKPILLDADLPAAPNRLQ